LQIAKTFAFSGAGSQSWLTDVDYLLEAFAAQMIAAGNILVTTDATLTIAQVTAGIVAFSEVLIYGGGAANSTNQRSGLSVPIPAGTTLLVRAGASGVIQLYLNPSAEM